MKKIYVILSIMLLLIISIGIAATLSNIVGEPTERVCIQFCDNPSIISTEIIETTKTDGWDSYIVVSATLLSNNETMYGNVACGLQLEESECQAEVERDVKLRHNLTYGQQPIYKEIYGNSNLIGKVYDWGKKRWSAVALG